MKTHKRIFLTPGEPAGIGPDITIQAAQQPFAAELIAVADPLLLQQRAAQLSLPLELSIWHPQDNITPHQVGHLKVFPVPLCADVKPGEFNIKNASYVITTLTKAALLCQNKISHALVTGPVHKGAVNQAGIAFTGHTEFFAELCHVSQTVMLFVLNKLKIALATTHLPLIDVAKNITKNHLHSCLQILHNELKTRFQLASPKIYVCGLNPHAGESGYLGREEIDVITPCLDNLRKSGMDIIGPLPADTIFTQKYLNDADAILAMYHDQALPLIKYLGFGHAVNMTLGLNFIRTSVDHGTAHDLAGTGQSDPGSMLAAIQLAIELCC